MGEIKKIGVGVGVMIVNNKNQLLLGLRNPEKEKKEGELTGGGLWTMPGGKVEIGETLKVKIYRVENYENAQSISDLGEGQYIDFEVELFEFNINT